MSVFKRGNVWWYKINFAGREIRESSKSHSKTVAVQAEKMRRRELEAAYNNLADRRGERIQTLASVSSAYLEDYKLKHRSVVYASYCIRHLNRLLGKLMIADIADESVKSYQRIRLKEGAAPKTINEEVGFLLRVLRERGDAIRLKLTREKSLKLKTPKSIGKAFDHEEVRALETAAAVARTGVLPSGERRTRKNPGTRSHFILPALKLAIDAGLRHGEIRHLKWGNIDLQQRVLVVGKSKTDAGEGRAIPLSNPLVQVLNDHAEWYTSKFGTCHDEWYIFPARPGSPQSGEKRPFDPSQPITSLKTAFRNVKKQAGVTGRFHDGRHTFITDLAETGKAADETIRDMAGHVSKDMLNRYSHIRLQTKRQAIDALVEKRNRPEPQIAPPDRIRGAGGN